MNALGRHLDEYLRLRRMLGHDLAEAHRLLPRFVSHLEDRGIEFVTVEAALAWSLERDVPAGSVVPGHRWTVVRGFARYMSGIDPRTEVPPAGMVRTPQRWRPPFIYADADVLALIEQIPRSIPQPLRAATYETLIGLLAATGLRVGEALRLDRSDIDWVDGAPHPPIEVFRNRGSCRCSQARSMRSSATTAAASNSVPRRARRACLCRCAEPA